MVSTRPLTAADVEQMGKAGERMELIDGVLREKQPVSQRHGEIEIRISSPLHMFVDRNGLGRVYPSDTQFVVLRDPDKILIPDVAFVRAARLRPEAERWRMAPYPPDLAVEVVSPNDSAREVAEKLDLYDRAGVPLVWVVRPPRRAVEVRPHGRPPFTLGEGDTLDGGDVVPGFRLLVADIFA
jgi:Uma2 family endonuclease